MKPLLFFALLLGVPSCSEDPPPPGLPLPGKLVPAPGLAAADFEVFGPASDEPRRVEQDGGFEASVLEDRAGVLFAAAREGTVAAKQVGAGSGLYLAPALGAARLVESGEDRRLASEGTVRLDAMSTVLALLLLHPMVAHPLPEVQSEQARWLLHRQASGWPELASAARAYDAALAAGRSPAADTAFRSSLESCLAAVAEQMSERLPTPPDDEPLEAPAAEGVAYAVATGRSSVTSLQVVAREKSSLSVRPRARRGTGLDYFYSVARVADSAMPKGVDSEGFAHPDPLRVLTVDQVLASGFLPARGYQVYPELLSEPLAVLGEELGGELGLPPEGSAVLPEKGIYELRLFSGAVAGEPERTLVQTSFAEAGSIAFRHNATAALSEALSLLPVGELVLGDRELLSGAAEEAAKALAAHEAQATGGVDVKAAYQLLHPVYRWALAKSAELSLARAKQSGRRRVLAWLGRGGKELLALTTASPGSPGRGGSLARRAQELALPASVMEHYLIGVGYRQQSTSSIYLDQAMVKQCLGTPGNTLPVGISAVVRSAAEAWDIAEVQQHEDHSVLASPQALLSLTASNSAALDSLVVTFSPPAKKVVEGETDEGERFVWRWVGFKNVSASYVSSTTGEWEQHQQSGGSFVAPTPVQIAPGTFSAQLTALAETAYELYQKGSSTVKSSTGRTYKLVLTFK